MRYDCAVALLNDMRKSILNFCAEWYLFPEWVTYKSYTPQLIPLYLPFLSTLNPPPFSPIIAFSLFSHTLSLPQSSHYPSYPFHLSLFYTTFTLLLFPSSAFSLFPYPQISCVSSSILLSNRTRYRAYFQMLPSEADISAAIYGTIRAYGWGYLAIITQNENILTLVSAWLCMHDPGAFTVWCI